MHQTQSQSVDAETLHRLLGDVREAAEQIDPADAAYLRTYVDTLQAEATSEQPNHAIVTGTVERLTKISGKAGNAALTASITTLVGVLLPAIGIG